MLAVVIAEKKFEDIPYSLKASKAADLVELRLDYLKQFELSKMKNLIKNCKKQLIITNRKKSEGGFFEGNEQDRIQILRKAIEYGADYVDIECSSDKRYIVDLIKNKNKTKIIVSYHNFKETPNNLQQIYKNIKKFNPDFIKIVTYANNCIDNFKIFELIKIADKENKSIIAFCMGSYGQFSRILSLILGSNMTYASLEKGKESADGQLTVRELVEYYRIKQLDNNTKIFGLIGNPVEHSWSHIIHNAAFDRLKINAVYLKFRVDKLQEFIEYFRKLNVGGFSVTIPHKIDVMRYLDHIDKKAEKIGAVNTIAVKKNKLIGYNTDCDGAVQALNDVVDIRGKQVLVLGTGGAARAIVYGLKENGAKPLVLSRSIEKAAKFAEEFDVHHGRMEDIGKLEYDVLVNATPAGMYPDVNKSSIPLEFVPSNAVVMDMIFNPHKTKLLKEAARKKCMIVSGIDMLINQAALQFKLWTSKEAPVILMKNILNHLKNAGNQN